ncbi:MAG: hypothetical protein PHX54_12180 [Lentimicrobiaceae bacterium]|nr:hypothetical protein [Lentimicrobiaceae bacterium]
MRTAFLILILVHGIIHLMGFVKAFGISDVTQLTLPISKPSGIVWILAFAFFILTGLMFVFKNNYWWLYGFIAVVISQVLIIYFWHDARYGTIANFIILILVITGFGTWSFYNVYQKDVTKCLRQKSYFGNTLLTEADIEHLPEPVKNYIRYSGSIGKPRVNNFVIESTGKIRKNEESEWMPFTTKQYNFMDVPTRLFFMKAKMKHLPVAGYHCYKDGDAFMDIRLFSLFRVQYQDGAEMDMAETVTFFNDMCCMAPATLIDKRIKWLETDNNKVKASFTNNNITIYAWLYFNDKGELENFISNDRYDYDAGKKLPWSTPLKDYREINGYRLARYADAIYSYQDKEFCYGTFNLTGTEYNVK